MGDTMAVVPAPKTSRTWRGKEEGEGGRRREKEGEGGGRKEGRGGRKEGRERRVHTRFSSMALIRSCMVHSLSETLNSPHCLHNSKIDLRVIPGRIVPEKKIRMN
jgi:hypothetical protein